MDSSKASAYEKCKIIHHSNAYNILLTAFIIERYFKFCAAYGKQVDQIIAHLMVIDLMAMLALEVLIIHLISSWEWPLSAQFWAAE